MKRYLVLILAFFIICTPSFASKLKELPYKNIDEGKGIKYTDAGIWTDKAGKRDSARLVRNGSLLNSADGSISYDTGCSYLFINNGNLFGYSPIYTKYFELSFSKEQISKRELTVDEVGALFEKFKIIKVSDFSEYTNAYKFTREKRKIPVMVLNDTEEAMPSYVFSTNNAKIDRYITGNAILIKRGGMLQFST